MYEQKLVKLSKPATCLYKVYNGGRGKLYGAIIGAAFVSLFSSWFTGGQAPDIPLGIFTIEWVNWWTVLLGFGFVIITIFSENGIIGFLRNIFVKEK